MWIHDGLLMYTDKDTTIRKTMSKTYAHVQQLNKGNV